jgi:hypothetical protein
MDKSTVFYLISTTAFLFIALDIRTRAKKHYALMREVSSVLREANTQVVECLKALQIARELLDNANAEIKLLHQQELIREEAMMADD